MPERKMLIVAAVAIVLGFAMGRCHMCINQNDRYDENQTGKMQTTHQQHSIAPQNSANHEQQAPADRNRLEQERNGNRQLQNPAENGDASCEEALPDGGSSCDDTQQGAARQSEALAETLLAAEATLKVCYDAALQIVPDLSPKLELRVFLKSLNGRGRLNGIENLNLLMLPPETLTCLSGEISKLNFDLSESRDGDETSVTVHLNFGKAK